MKNILYNVLLFCLIGSPLLAQESGDQKGTIEETPMVKKKDKPVRSPWNSGILMGGRTSVVPGKGTLRFELVHHFGSMQNGISDFFGIYADGANIRMGLSYVPMKNLQVGVGLTKYNMTTDLNLKYTILEQTRENTVPVSVTVSGVMGIDGRAKESFGTEYVFIDRLSYFSELMLGRKFSKAISFQAGINFTHINNMPEGVNHDVVGVNLGAKVRLTSTLSIIANTDFPLDIKSISEYTTYTTANPNIQLGVEIITTSHAFQIYVGSSNHILPQNVYARNQVEFDKDGIRFGFILTKL